MFVPCILEIFLSSLFSCLHYSFRGERTKLSHVYSFIGVEASLVLLCISPNYKNSTHICTLILFSFALLLYPIGILNVHVLSTKLRGRTVRPGLTCAEQFRVPSFMLRLLARFAKIARKLVCKGSSLLLYK
jgi:hypothetical protein